MVSDGLKVELNMCFNNFNLIFDSREMLLTPQAALRDVWRRNASPLSGAMEWRATVIHICPTPAAQ